MKNTTLTVDDLIGHMAEACRKITDYTAGMDEMSFYQSSMVIDAVLKNIEIMGEAANSLLKNFPIFTENEPSIPWRQLYGMRNRLTHGYFDIDKKIVWNTIAVDIPAIAAALDDINERHADHLRMSQLRNSRPGNQK